MPQAQVLDRVGIRPPVVDPDQLLAGMVSVSCGTKEALCFPGRTVAELRQELKDRLSIPEGARVVMDGKPVRKSEEDVTIVGGETRQLEFVGPSGAKG